jgi:multiple antibiotic resistance protein
MDFNLFLSAIISIFVMADPFGNIPIFLGLTSGMSGEERRYTITKASIVAAIILVVFALVGKPFMEILSISLNSLRIAGGILLMTIAFDMLMGKETRSKATEGDSKEDPSSIAITPMATPLITGPGAMTVTMVYMNEATGYDNKALIMAAIVVAMVGSWIVVVNSDLLFSIFRKDGTRVLTKIMGIVLAAIATGMMIAGLTGSFPALLV